jgi:hypothetical protein
VVEVVVSDEFRDWYQGLGTSDAEAVAYYVELLEINGVGLGSPHSSQIKGASFGLRELRVQSHGRPLRVFYAFDPKRQAVLLIGGDKTGTSDDRFYAAYVPTATAIWKEYLREIGHGN